MGELLLEMKNICKSFFGVPALNNVSLQLKPGEVHALLGENGAGKSTLIKILGGIYAADSGEILINGQKVTIHSVLDAQNRGIAIIHQEVVLVPDMTIAENIFLGREYQKNGFMDDTCMNRKTQELLDSFNMGFRADSKVKELTLGQQQMIEIIKASSFNVKILVMDEPTSSLSDVEVQQLFTLIRKLRSENIGIIYISHRMSELHEISDRITVLRDGKYIGTKETASTNEDELVEMMVGRQLTSYFSRSDHKLGKVVLSVKDLNRRGVAHDINFEIREGEILGFSGLIGAGRTELMKCIFGLDKIDSGEILIDGHSVSIKSPSDAVRTGIALVPESRKEQGLFMIQDLNFNISFNVLDRFIHGCFVDESAEKELTRSSIQKLMIKTSSSKLKLKNLSGGNQQKVSIAKWLATNPKVLILDEPTRGVDVVAKSEIYSIMDELAMHGTAIIMISSDLPEVINMSDRVIVMNGGRIRGCLEKDELTQEKIIHYAIEGD